jgi:hypothetical protein
MRADADIALVRHAMAAAGITDGVITRVVTEYRAVAIPIAVETDFPVSAPGNAYCHKRCHVGYQTKDRDGLFTRIASDLNDRKTYSNLDFYPCPEGGPGYFRFCSEYGWNTLELMTSH